MSVAMSIVHLSLALALCGPAFAVQVPCEARELRAADPDDDDRLAQSVAIDGDFALLGAFKDDDLGSNSGSAYIYRFDGVNWTREPKLVASDGTSSDRFGWSVAISDTAAVIGAREADGVLPTSGAAYVFRRNAGIWTEEAKLMTASPLVDEEFGTSVAIAGDLALVGSNASDLAAVDGGSAHVFRWNGSFWSEEAELTASDATSGDGFGVAVALDGDLAVVGADLETQAGTASGAVYVFRFDGANWNQEAKLASADLAANDRFGFSVSVSGDRILVGAFSDDPVGTTSGSAYVFRFTGTAWVEEDKLIASDGGLVDVFGWSVALRGDAALVGAQLEDQNGTDAGAAYLFTREGPDWLERAKLVASDGAAQDFFGFSVGLAESALVVGAWGHDDVEDESGAAYVYRWKASIGTSYCGGEANSVGGGASLFATGSQAVADADFSLIASCTPPNASGLFYFGPLTIDLPFGDGRRCVGGATQRLQPPLFSDGAGTATRIVDLTVPPAAGLIAPGLTLNFQYWYRDVAGGPAGFNLSDAMTVVWQ